MMFPLVALALLLHAAWWGAGAALVLMPRPWARHWPVLVFPAAWLGQSLVVWAGAHAGLAGTNQYAWPAQVVPGLLLAWGLRRRGGWREAAGDLVRWRGVGAAVVGTLLLLVLPLTGLPGLTTVSLGSCDAADYAGGARVLMEFARGDRTGFVGLTEVVRVHSTDSFLEYWLRLNHFTPAALLALNGSVLHCAPHELGTLFVMVVLAGSLPVVFWLARTVLGFRSGAALLVAGLYGLSPVTWYAVLQVSPSQLLAAQAIALLTWAGVAAWRFLGAARRARAGRLAGVLALAYGILLGSYNFILLVCLVPAVAWVGGQVLGRRQRWPHLAGWSLVMVAPLVAAGAVFWSRVAGLAERLTLLRTFDFGWKIPLLTPEGWLGFLGRPEDLSPWPWAARAALLLVWLALVVAALAVAGARRRWIWCSLLLAPLTGYAYLQWRGAVLGTNASYDAYKLLAVFFPGILAASVAWLAWPVPRRSRRWIAVATVVLLLAQGSSVFQELRALQTAPLRVSFELRDVRRAEAMADVDGINLLIPDMWSRLWANALLLRKPQYFLTDTYEARWHTPLRGRWNLEAGRIAVVPPDGARRPLSGRYVLLDTRAPAYLAVTLGEGWQDEEAAGDPRRPGVDRWQWAGQRATIRVENPGRGPVRVVPTLDGRALGERNVTITVEGGPEVSAVRLDGERRRTLFPALTVPPGGSTLVLRSIEPAGRAGSDPRPLAVCVYQLELATSLP